MLDSAATIRERHGCSTRPSLIKPHLHKLAGSSSTLNGIVVERDLEFPDSETDVGPAKSPKHVIVLRAGAPAQLEWTMQGLRKQAVFYDGDAIINPAGLFTQPHWDSEVELVLLGVNPTVLDRVAEQMDGPPRVELVPRFGFRDELLRQLASALIREFEQSLPVDRVYTESLAHAILAHLLKKYSAVGLNPFPSRGGLSRRALTRILDFVNDQLAHKLSLEEIAGVAGLSPSHFIALFKQSTGTAPHQYVMNQRIEKAKQLLTRTKLPIAEIAARTGFADQSHLTRVLRSRTGLTPSKFRVR